jgi:hypothetical protein
MPYPRVLLWCLALIATGLPTSGYAQRNPPKFVPPGWSTQPVEGRRDVIHYVSPDRQAVLTLRDIPTRGASVRETFSDFSRDAGGPITYTRLAKSWFVISGYRGGEIFYVRVDRACDGQRWHVAELTYPRDQKAKMDPAVIRASHALSAYGEVCPNNEQR